MSKKKLILIIPTVTVIESERIRFPKAIYNPSPTLPSVASVVPNDYEIKAYEEEVDNIDFDEDCDIVGISCMTCQASRAFQIAEEFRKRGKTVVFGGHHPSAMPEECLNYGDSVVIGEAEGSGWKELLDDFLQNKKLKTIYRNDQLVDMSKIPPIRRNLFKNTGWLVSFEPLLFIRGCPYTCDFCSIPLLYGQKIRHFPIQRVINDIHASKGKMFFFYDDNILCKPKLAKELFRELIPLKIKWGAQASLKYLQDKEMLDLIVKSGCIFLLIGLESVSKSNLEELNKNYDDIQKISDTIKRVQDRGILVHTTMIFGFDHDTQAVFDETLDFLLKTEVSSALFNILTPYPGTKTFKLYQEQDRLLTTFWRYYDTHTVVFKPKNMTPTQLVDGYLHARGGFYSTSSIFKRLFAHKGSWNHPLIYMALNINSQFVTKRHRIDVPKKTNAVLNGRNPETCQYQDLKYEKTYSSLL